MKLPEPVQNFLVILGAVIAAFTTLAPAILAVINIVSMLGVATLGPIIGIIAGVAAAITAIIAIVKNWGAISEWFGDLWVKVKEKCSQVWESICSFFTETIPQAWDSLVAKFQSIPEWWSGIWQQVDDFFPFPAVIGFRFGGMDHFYSFEILSALPFRSSVAIRHILPYDYA